ncbi:acyl-CoA thioesterase [Sphingobacteriaceae bacterium WQ 2009]|uniref:Acyl-CoA thioesterase n=1 Tax=Rhinopithecimicrobium faecis TaxID=2820698 RepID=A0A8T4HAE6_9SPHI|nr:acyl-CoA thioesterase [Sphingobacteriaceae bacterium WQ 2009]
MFESQHTVRVRYAETDQMGYVYYGNYASYYEVARTEMLRTTGYSYKELEELGVMMPVLEMKCKYIKPARYDDLLTIKTQVRIKPSIRIVFHYEIFNEEGQLLNIGETTLVFVDMVKNKPCLPPPAFMKKLEPYFPA